MFNMAKFSDRLGDIMFDKDTSTAALSKQSACLNLRFIGI